MTLATARIWVVRWADSGHKFPVGMWQRIEIPDAATSSLVYYESPLSVSRFMRLTMRDTLATEPLAEIDYVSVASGTDLHELDRVEGATLLSLAVRLGSTRLIDNEAIQTEEHP